MCTYKVLFICVLCHLLDGIYGQKANKFFRNDYKYLNKTEAFYKIHTVHKNWRDARRTCSLEGASLFYPEDEVEATEVIKYMKETTPFHWLYIGVSDILSKGVFETIDGVPVTNIYHKWESGEPGGWDVENCVILHRDDFLRDESCAKLWPFVCKKPLNTLEWNTECNFPNMDYQYNQVQGKCYKFHVHPLNWSDAYSACSSEQSYLAIIDSQREAEELRTITAKAPKDNIEGDYIRGAVHLGFHNRDDEGWQTTKGIPLESSGYSNWSYTQPDGKGVEKCGSMFYDGYLNDIGCEKRMFFICEHDIDAKKVVDTSKIDIDTKKTDIDSEDNSDSEDNIDVRFSIDSVSENFI